ncbi:hypothetical protein PG990_011040 [Apiospora arundinis]
MLPNRRQKRPEEYSTNPNTIRARRRKARLSPYSKEVEQAKASDSKAVTRAWKQRIETDAYKMSSPNERKLVLEEVEKEVMDRRRSKGLDADTKIDRFMHRMHNNGPNPLDPSLRTPTPMQPVANMHSRYATPGSAMPYVMSSVESRAGTEVPFAPPHPLGHAPGPRHIHPSGLGFYHYPPEHEASPYAHGNMQHAQELAAAAHEAAKNAASSNGNADNKELAELKKLVKGLSDDLAIAKATIRAQEERLEGMAERMKAFDAAVGGLGQAESEFRKQNYSVQRAVQGMVQMWDIASKVADDIHAYPHHNHKNGGGIDGDNRGSNGINGAATSGEEEGEESGGDGEMSD